MSTGKPQLQLPTAEAVQAFREYLSVHSVGGQLPARLRDEMAVELALIALDFTAAQCFDLVAHLARQRAFSLRTFGPGMRLQGVLDHIRKELVEVEESGGALAEWVDVILLALDGAWRAGNQPEQIAEAIAAKQSKNEGRAWPDWRTVEPGKAIEHIRGGDST